MTRDVRAGMVTPGGVKTITRLVRCSVQQPPGPWRSCPAPATLIEVQIWPPGAPLCPLPPPHPLRWSGRGRRRYWTPGPDVGSTATSNFDKHCARNGSYPGHISHSQGWCKANKVFITLIIIITPLTSPHSCEARHPSPGIVASSQVCCPLIDGMEGTKFLTACHLCWEILHSLMYPLLLC